MTTRRVMGIETEYGVSVPGQPASGAMVASSQVVNGWASGMADGPAAHPPHPLGLRGGEPAARRARLRRRRRRTDHLRASPRTTSAWPTSSSPTAPGCTSTTRTPSTPPPRSPAPRDAVLWDKAGERVMARAAERALHVPGTPRILLYKNNTDGKGASYGTHENYLMARQTPFADIVRHLTPFFVSRQVVTGAGRVGIGQDGRDDGFQLSQRADFFEVEVGLETTLKRPDHQHPRRAARRPGQVPPAARHHRRRQPVGGLDLPQGRHDGAGAGDDRGRLAARRTAST